MKSITAYVDFDKSFSERDRWRRETFRRLCRLLMKLRVFDEIRLKDIKSSRELLWTVVRETRV